LGMPRMPLAVMVPLVVIGPPEKTNPVVPPETLTLVTLPIPPPPPTAVQTRLPVALVVRAENDPGTELGQM